MLEIVLRKSISEMEPLEITAVGYPLVGMDQDRTWVAFRIDAESAQKLKEREQSGICPDF